MSAFELLKVLVQPVAIERDDDGNIIGERVGETTALYSIEQTSEFIERLRNELANGGQS